jgi:hypothetical protein
VLPMPRRLPLAGTCCPACPTPRSGASSTPGSRRLTARDCRNIVIGRRRAVPQLPQTGQREKLETVGIARWEQNEIDLQLRALGLPRNAPLGVLAVEILPEIERKPDPLGADLGRVRILRASPLIPVPEVCL